MLVLRAWPRVKEPQLEASALRSACSVTLGESLISLPHKCLILGTGILTSSPHGVVGIM